MIANIFDLWQTNLVLFLFFFVCFFQFYKLAVRNVHKDAVATVTLQLVASVFALPLIPLSPLQFPGEIRWYQLLAIACVFYAVNDRLQTTARKNLQVSVYSVINQLNTVFLIIYGAVIFREPLTAVKLLGATLILSANILLRYSRGKIEVNKYVGIAVLATLTSASAISIDIGVSKYFNLPIYILISLFVPALILISLERVRYHDILALVRGKDGRYYYLTGVSWTLAIYFSLRSFQLGSVTTIVPLQAVSVLLNVVVAYVFLGERKGLTKKLVAAVMVIAGIYLTVRP